MSDEGWPASDEWVWDFDAEIDVMEQEFRMNSIEQTVASKMLGPRLSSSMRAVARLTWNTARRVLRVFHSVFTVTRRHVPKWLAGVLTVCLFIPGPLDEFLVLIVIAVMVKFKPVMRAELVSGVKSAWTTTEEIAA